MLAQPDDIDSPFSAVEVEVATGPRGSLMDKLAWVLSATIIAVAIVGAVCNALVRNTVAAISRPIVTRPNARPPNTAPSHHGTHA